MDPIATIGWDPTGKIDRDSTIIWDPTNKIDAA